MRILHVFKTYFPETQGGLQETIRQICMATAPHGFEHRVLTVGNVEQVTRVRLPEADVVCCPKSAGSASFPLSLETLPLFRREVRTAHIVHYHFPWPLMDVLHLLCAVRKPSIVTYHADIVRAPHLFFLYKPLLHRFLGRVDRVVATSDALMQTSPVLRRVKEKTVVIPLGIAEETYPVPTEKEVREVRAAYGDGFFLFVGVLRYYKGLDYLMEAVRGQPFRIVVVGDGPERERLERKASSLNLENVAFAGRVNDSQKMAFLRLCRAVVCPSHLPAEAYGLSLVEGAMMGKPLVCCSLGTGTTFVNRHMETGVVVPPADPKELREALRILHNDPALAERLGAGARSHFVANLRAETMGHRYSQLYRDLLL